MSDIASFIGNNWLSLKTQLQQIVASQAAQHAYVMDMFCLTGFHYRLALGFPGSAISTVHAY